MYARAVRPPGTQNRAVRLSLAMTLPLALAYLVASGAIVFFRQTSALQPFMFLMASFCVVVLVQQLARFRWAAAALAAGLVGVIGVVPWTQAFAVFEAHQGLGRALEWANAHRADRQLVWLPIAWFDDQTSVTSPEELQQLPADTWLISYYPFSTVRDHPSLQAYLDSTVPVAEWPSLYTTDAMLAELKGTSDDDLRFNQLLSKIRVTRVGDIVANMQGEPLAVSQVTADSVSGAFEPLNVFDGDSSPDNKTEWVSGNGPQPHWLQIDLAQPTVLGAVNVVLPSLDRSPYRMADMNVEVQDATGAFRTAWSGHNLVNSPLVHASWPASSITAIRIGISAEVRPWTRNTNASIEEVVFPGYRVIAPPPARLFPPLELSDVQLTARGLEVVGTNLTTSTSLLVGSVVFPTVGVSTATHLVARVPPEVQGHAILSSVSLVDRFRQSTAVQVELRPPVLQRVDPALVQVDAADVMLTATTDDAVPGTAIVFDAHPLNTFFGSPHWLTAPLPRELITGSGPHTVSVRNALGESDAQEFTVGLADAGLDQAHVQTSTDPLVVRDMGPSNVHVGEAPGLQPDGALSLWLDVQGATPGSIVVLDGQPLPTFYAGSESMTAILPANLYGRAATHEVYVQRGQTRSAARDLVVGEAIVDVSNSTDPVVIRDVSPANVHVGEGPRQPDDTFAVTLDVEGAALGTVVVLDGQPLRTFYGGGTYVTAVLPSDFYDKAATHELYATRGTVRSAPRDLAVTP
jgi:hypothetical protein